MIKCDFSGWATRNDLTCSDGRIIRKDAFKHQDGETIPLVYGHNQKDINSILGHAILENRDEGVYAYCTFNNTESGQSAKEAVMHGDIRSLSIYANKLKENAGNVVHGVIRELSLVLAGANPGATIDFVMQHEDGCEEPVLSSLEACWDEHITLYHSDESEKDNESGDTDNKESDETVQDIIDTMTDKQRNVMFGLIGELMDDEGEDDENEEGDEEEMKHNLFDQDEKDTTQTGYLTHADQENILKMAKHTNVGSFQHALEMFADDNDLQHDALASGFAQPAEGVTGSVDVLFPEYKEVRPGAPELVTNDQGWISAVMAKVHKSPISRIRTSHVDIRNLDTLRAKGYKKGKEKGIVGNFTLARRTTDPQTVFVKNALHRDDIIDITDFSYVDYLYRINRMALMEELAMAIMLGDGRDEDAEDKIQPAHIRPIWLDDELYTRHYTIDFAAARTELQGANTGANFGTNYITAEAMVNTCLYAREQYKGTGTPDMYITPHMLNVMLLARDLNGRRIYSSKAELASSLNVGNIFTAEQFEGKTRTDDKQKTKKLVAMIVNLSDYSLGATKGGEITHFTQFDIKFNQELSLLETRCSGALTRLASAIAIEEDVTPANGGSSDDQVAAG